MISSLVIKMIRKHHLTTRLHLCVQHLPIVPSLIDSTFPDLTRLRLASSSCAAGESSVHIGLKGDTNPRLKRLPIALR